MRRVPGVDELFRVLARSTQMAAATAVTAALAPLARGGKILWSALPYAVKTTDPGTGHVGAVQPDGTTTDVDADTGILMAAIPLDGLTTGTTAYFVEGTGWVLLPIS